MPKGTRRKADYVIKKDGSSTEYKYVDQPADKKQGTVAYKGPGEGTSVSKEKTRIKVGDASVAKAKRSVGGATKKAGKEAKTRYPASKKGTGTPLKATKKTKGKK